MKWAVVALLKLNFIFCLLSKYGMQSISHENVCCFSIQTNDNKWVMMCLRGSEGDLYRWIEMPTFIQTVFTIYICWKLWFTDWKTNGKTEMTIKMHKYRPMVNSAIVCLDEFFYCLIFYYSIFFLTHAHDHLYNPNINRSFMLQPLYYLDFSVDHHPHGTVDKKFSMCLSHFFLPFIDYWLQTIFNMLPLNK